MIKFDYMKDLKDKTKTDKPKLTEKEIRDLQIKAVDKIGKVVSK